MTLAPFRPLFSGLLAGLAAACSVYDVPAGLQPSGGAAGTSETGAGGAISGTGGATGGDDRGGAPSISDATGGAPPAETSAAGSGGQSPANDAEVPRESSADVTTTSDGGGSVLALPFAVDTYFRATGYMGDGITPGNIVQQSAGCKLPRPPGARGNCYKITYKVQSPEVGSAWGGVYWQYPDNNWGTTAGKRIAQGAKRVSFYAASDSGTEAVTFRVGGIQNAGAPHQDMLKVDLPETLSTTLTQYSIDITGQPYDEVLGPFAWIVMIYDPARWAAGAMPVVIYLDDIHWE